MTQNRYRVVLSGGVKEGKSIDAVKERMAAMFKTSVARIGMLFQHDRSIIKKEIDLETAKKYARAIESAGANCSIEPMAPAAAHAPQAPVEEGRALKEETGRAEPRVVVIQLMQKPEDRFAPMPIEKITGAPDGLNLNTTGLTGFPDGTVPYDRLSAIVTFTETGGADEKNSLLLYIDSIKRPVVCDIDAIVYSDFPVKVLPKSMATFRGFLYFLCRKNPSIILEETTFDFLSGSLPQKLEQTKILKLATGMGALIESGDIGAQT